MSVYVRIDVNYKESRNKVFVGPFTDYGTAQNWCVEFNTRDRDSWKAGMVAIADYTTEAEPGTRVYDPTESISKIVDDITPWS